MGTEQFLLFIQIAMKIIIFFVLVGLCWACSKQSRYENLPKIEGYDSLILSNGKNIQVDSFFILPLEFTSESAITSIAKIEIVDTFIFIHSENSLLRFYKDGRFAGIYGVVGRAPGEYLRLNTFFIDRHRETVNLIDEFLSKIITYTFTGEYLREKHYAGRNFYMLHGVCPVGENQLLCDYYVYNDFNTLYMLLNMETGEKTVLSQTALQTKKVAVPIGKVPMAEYGDTVKVLLPFDNRIYVYDSLGIKPYKWVETEKKLLSSGQMRKINDFSVMSYFDIDQRGDFAGFKDICESDRYMLLNEAGCNRYFLVDKISAHGIRYDYDVDDALNVLPLVGIQTVWRDFFVGVLPRYSLKDIADKIPANTTDRNLYQLKKFEGELPEDANPCLVFYKLN